MKKERTKLIIIAVLGMLGFLVISLVMAFCVKEEDIPKWSLFSSFFFGFATLTLSLLAMTISIKSFINVNKEKEIRIKKEAESFVANYNDEIDLLPLCVIANAYSSTHKYIRDIYNAFNRLDNETKENVLKIMQVKYGVLRTNSWIDGSLNKIKNFIEEYDLGRDILYDNAKYYRSMFEMPNVQYSLEKELEHFFPDFSPSKKYHFIGDDAFVENVSFFDYVRQYVIYKVHNDPRIIAYGSEKPIDYYCKLFDFGECSPEICALIAVNVVDTVAHIIMEKYSSQNQNVELMPIETTHITSYEDRFLQSLSTLYDLSKYNLGK